MTAIPVYILAGGRSTRFGSDKALALFRDQPLLLHVAAMLRPVASETTVVAERTGKYDNLGLPTIADLQPNHGPVGGLASALRHLPYSNDWLLLCCCDAIIVHTAWLHTLLDAVQDRWDAVAFKEEHWQPMPAIYHRRALPLVEQCLDSNRNSMSQLLGELRTRVLQQPPDWPACWQANSKAEIDQFSK